MATNQDPNRKAALSKAVEIKRSLEGVETSTAETIGLLTKIDTFADHLLELADAFDEAGDPTEASHIRQDALRMRGLHTKLSEEVTNEAAEADKIMAKIQDVLKDMKSM